MSVFCSILTPTHFNSEVYLEFGHIIGNHAQEIWSRDVHFMLEDSTHNNDDTVPSCALTLHITTYLQSNIFTAEWEVEFMLVEVDTDRVQWRSSNTVRGGIDCILS